MIDTAGVFDFSGKCEHFFFLPAFSTAGIIKADRGDSLFCQAVRQLHKQIADFIFM